MKRLFVQTRLIRTGGPAALLLFFCLAHSLSAQMLVTNARPNKLKTNLVTASSNTTGSARIMIWDTGQSNDAAGVLSVADSLESEYKHEYTNIKYYQYSANNAIKFVNFNYADNTAYQSLDQNGNYSLQFYLYSQIQTLLGTDLYVVQHAQGNTGLAVEWKSTATVGQHYRDMVYKFTAAKNAITDVDGIAPSVKFLLVVRGEYDSRVLAYANAYQQNTLDYIDNVRSQTGLPNLPVIILQLNSQTANATVNPLTYWSTIRSANSAVVGLRSYVYLVESNGAQMHTDWIHYTKAGVHTLVASILAVIAANNLFYFSPWQTLILLLVMAENIRRKTL